MWNCPPLSGSARQCSRGACDFTGKPHLIIEGSAKGFGMLATLAAQYPKRFCSQFALTVRTHHFAAMCKHLERLSFES